MVGCARFLGEIFQMRRKFRQAGPQHGIAARPRPCLINGRMPKGERFFRQSRRIFAGGLTPGKKIQRRVAEKDPPLGRFDIFQTWPSLRLQEKSMYSSSCKKRGCCKPKRLQQPLLFNQISGFRKRGGLLAQESIQLRLGLGHDVFEAGSAHLGHHLIHGGLGIAGTGLD